MPESGDMVKTNIDTATETRVLSKEEMEIWKSQIVISNKEKKGLRKRPYAFTQEGVAT